jgi:surface antigen
MLRSTKARALLVAGAAVLAAATLTTGSASAATYQVSGVGGAGLSARSAPSTGASVPNCAGTVSELNPSAYPWPNVAPTTYIADGYGYYEGECTSFAAWAVRNQGLQYVSSPNSLGNADSWHATRTEYTPHVGDIAQWGDNHNGADGVGHVAYVSEVYGDGTIQVEEYNWLTAADDYTGHRYESRRIPATDPSDYLQF